MRCPQPSCLAAVCPTIAATSMCSTEFNKEPSYGLPVEVNNWLLHKYDPQKEAELRSWIEGLTGLLPFLTSGGV